MSRLLDVLKSCGGAFQDCFTVADLTAQDEALVYVNESFLSLTGYSREEIIHKNCRFMQGEQTDKNTVTKIREQVNKRESFYIDVVNYKKNGTPFWNRLCLIPITHNEEPRYYIGIQQDVTSKKENTMSTSLTDYLAREQASKEVARFIKNPLLNIINSSRSLSYFNSGEDESLKQEIASTIKQEVAKISQYVRSLP